MLYSPGTTIADDLLPPEVSAPPTDTKPESQADTQPGTQVQAPQTPSQPAQPQPTLDTKALMEAINADRVQREKLAKEAAERDSFQKRAEAAEKALADIEKAKKNRLLDPAGFLRKLGYTDRDLALTSEGIMFSLMPDKAPAGWVANLVKAQREQDQLDAEEKDKQRETEAQRRAAEEHTTREKEIEARYQGSLEREVAAFKPGTYKASQAWFADDHKAYAQELFETARTLAEEAVKAGHVIDVSGAAIAAHVEKKYADRAQRLVAAFSPAQAQLPTQPQKQESSPAPSKPEVASPTTVIAKSRITDKERIERAIAAAFGRQP